MCSDAFEMQPSWLWPLERRESPRLLSQPACRSRMARSATPPSMIGSQAAAATVGTQQSEGDSRLVLLCADDEQVNEVSTLLAKGVLPRGQHLAAALEQCETPRTFACARALLKAKADPNWAADLFTIAHADDVQNGSTNPSGSEALVFPMTPLMRACLMGDLLAVEFLLDAGADASFIPDPGGAAHYSITLLMLTCVRGHHACAKLLLDHGCLTAETSQGNPAWEGDAALNWALKAMSGTSTDVLGECDAAGARQCAMLILERERKEDAAGLSARHLDDLVLACVHGFKPGLVAECKPSRALGPPAMCHDAKKVEQSRKMVDCLLEARVDPNTYANGTSTRRPRTAVVPLLPLAVDVGSCTRARFPPSAVPHLRARSSSI